MELRRSLAGLFLFALGACAHKTAKELVDEGEKHINVGGAGAALESFDEALRLLGGGHGTPVYRAAKLGRIAALVREDAKSAAREFLETARDPVIAPTESDFARIAYGLTEVRANIEAGSVMDAADAAFPASEKLRKMRTRMAELRDQLELPPEARDAAKMGYTGGKK